MYYLNQYISKTLNTTGGIDNSQTTDIELPDGDGLELAKPGIAILSYTNPLDTDNAEWITYTSINAVTFKFEGVTRGQEGYGAKAHAKGVTIAFPISKSHINDINDLLTGVTEIGNDISLATGYNIQVNSDDPYRTIVIPAGSMSPTTTAGCAAIATVEAGTNDVDYKVLDFDKDTDESAFFLFAMPDSWDAGTVTWTPYWTTAGTTGDVVFSIAGRAFANDDAIDQAYGTAVTSDDTFIAAGDVHIGPVSGAMTFAGTPAGGQLVQVKITRDVSEDDLDADARLIALKMEYQVAQYSD